METSDELHTDSPFLPQTSRKSDVEKFGEIALIFQPPPLGFAW